MDPSSIRFEHKINWSLTGQKLQAHTVKYSFDSSYSKEGGGQGPLLLRHQISLGGNPTGAWALSVPTCFSSLYWYILVQYFSCRFCSSAGTGRDGRDKVFVNNEGQGSRPYFY